MYLHHEAQLHIQFLEELEEPLDEHVPCCVTIGRQWEHPEIPVHVQAYDVIVDIRLWISLKLLLDLLQRSDEIVNGGHCLLASNADIVGIDLVIHFSL